MSVIPEWLRSILLTFAITLLGLVLTPGFDFTEAGIVAAVVAAARTAASGLLPGGSFGLGTSEDPGDH